MKTFSFIDSGNQDFVRYETHESKYGIVKIEAEDHGHAQELMFETDLCEDTNWTNTGVKTWCWEDME